MKDWIRKLLSEADGSASLKRHLFAVSVVFVLGFCTAEFIHARSITANLIELMKTVLYVTGGAYVGGRFAEASENKSSAFPTS